MPRQRREPDPEGLGDDSRRKDDNPPPSRASSRRRRHPSLHRLSFPRMLASAALNKHKVAPLFTARYGKKTIRLRTLQHMIVCNLRRDLAGQVKTICDTDSAENMEAIRKTMKHYVCALRDLRYMLETPSQNDANSKFLIDRLYISTVDDAATMIDAGFMTPTRQPADLHVPDYTGYGGYSQAQDSERQQTKEFLSRLYMALFGGCSLIVPMLIMRLHPTLLTELVTTSVFVLSVGVILAWYMKDARKSDILAATATYAAVLVVFVGTTS